LATVGELWWLVGCWASQAETFNEPTNDFRSPSPSRTGFYSNIREAWRYLVRRKGLSSSQARVLSFFFRRQMVKQMHSDLKVVISMRDSDMRVVRIACQQLAFKAVKAGGSTCDGFFL
jgi:hypothetical protein